MFRKNDGHLQVPLFSSLDALTEKQQELLEKSWAGVFYREFFVRLDERVFGQLYSDVPSRPNVPVNVLVGLEALKSGFGWSDQELYEHYQLDLQVRYALGVRDWSDGDFELRTLYNFRQRHTQHMQGTGENLIARAFEQVSEEQLEAFELRSTQLRMDSTQIASNLRDMSRVQLLVEVLQRVYRMLNEGDRERYGSDVEGYVKVSSGQYVYPLKREDQPKHLQSLGELLAKLLNELRDKYGEEPTFAVLERVFGEHFVVAEALVTPVPAEELSARSLQSPDDWEATFRAKHGQYHKGFVTNVTETCDEENKLQLMVKVQTEPNSTDDGEMLAEALPDLKERTEVDVLHTDGGFNGEQAYKAMRKHEVEHVPTAIRGGLPSGKQLKLDAFGVETDKKGVPLRLTCPHGQSAEVYPGAKGEWFNARFETEICASCPLFGGECPVTCGKRDPRPLFRFTQRNVDLAVRRCRMAEQRASKKNPRAAVEATVRSLKHPFGNGKLPVRGLHRASMMMAAGACMVNVRRIHAHFVKKRAAEARMRAELQADSPVFAAERDWQLRSALVIWLVSHFPHPFGDW